MNTTQNMENRNDSGFTLIELLVVTGIFVAVSGIIGGILFSTLRGSETTRTTTQIAQNGNFAMTALSDVIKQSRQVVNVYEDEPLENFVDCTNNPTGTHITLRMPDNREATLTCDHNEEHKIASSSAQRTYLLTDSNVRVVENSCKISCFQPSAFSAPRVEIQFGLGKADSTNGIVEDTSEHFQTQINIRNFNNQ
jgi:prepilin-type N-terminal cleavage/methylation domain-containing protein